MKPRSLPSPARLAACLLVAGCATPKQPPPFATLSLPAERTVAAPDGSDVRVLLALPRGSMAHFTLAPGEVATAARHRTVEELWYILSGQGEMWRRQGDSEAVVPLAPGVNLTIPVGTAFQFRSIGPEPLRVVGVTMPPWPGENEAVIVPGKWTPTVPRR
jgi:mannose-6-phosphate isomerase-like protein (cupin superfamily)